MSEFAQSREVAVASSPQEQVAAAMYRLRRWAVAGAVACGLALVGSQETEAAKIQEMPALTAPGDCPLNLMSGPFVACERDPIPAACVTDTAKLEQFQYDPLRRRQAASIADKIMDNDDSEPRERDFRFIGQDDGAVIDDNGGNAESALFLGKLLGATDWRVILHPHLYNRRGNKKLGIPSGRQRYDLAMDRIVACGLDPRITISCMSEKPLDPQRFAAFAASITRRYPEAKYIEPCNEPNEGDKWLQKEPGMTLPQTYRAIYEASRKAIIAVNPDVKIGFGNFSGSEDRFGRTALEFFEQSLQCPDGKKECDPTIADVVDWHFYQWFKGRKGELVFDKSNQDAKQMGIEYFELIKDAVATAYKEGRLETPDGKKPPISNNEYGASERARRTMRDRNMHPADRAAHGVQVLAKLCNDPDVESSSQYQIVSQPTWREEIEHWDTSLTDDDGDVDLAYYAMAHWANSDPECLVK